MLAKLSGLIEVARELVASLESQPMRADDVAIVVERFAELERLAVAGRTLAARRVERSKVWFEEGFSTPARWMAAKAQTTLASAISTIETARRLEELPETRRALETGSLSAVQAAEISAAAFADPSAERKLLETAKVDSVAELRERCRSVIAAAAYDKDADERIHRGRYLRSWSDPDGAFRLDARMTSDAGARLMTVVRARCRALQEEARRARSKERMEAHAADALVSLAGDATPQPGAVVHVHVDEAAWTRGHAVQGERCEIPGVGPVPVAAARRLAREGLVKAVVTSGIDVRAVAHLGRTIPATIRTALEARDVTCVVPGCDARDGLEIDHVVPFAEGGPTRLDNLARLCRWHHSLKTHRGWRLSGVPGRWDWSRNKTRAAGRARSDPAPT
jgi:uncharacterized protein DUF222/HNH endonuclease